ncbi:hypothetical protein KKF34_10170 [Myxococcota bacterium]|nr:hypothetical protein [Myxococcota bacterium]MBU1380420.1 hypothetical protein [Myxococcota bacterium]MBU1497230.1 hypothetical protein [Myxococcota bacterium]
MKNFIITMLVLVVPVFAAAKVPRFQIEFEGGGLWQTRNEVQIPNEETASRIDLTEMIGSGPLPAFRLYFTWNITPDHGLRLLAAPLEVTKSKVITSDLVFDRVTFAAGQKTDFTYKFNSWRLNYNYRIFHRNNFNLRIGFTAKIRDAKVEIRQSGTKGVLTDLGFVPLAYVAIDWEFHPGFHLNFDFNGLAGGPGRAFDVALKAIWDINNRISVSAGYRTVEGGADVDAVYNFAWLHYGIISVIGRF